MSRDSTQGGTAPAPDRTGRARSAVAWLATACLLSAGCNSLRLYPLTNDKPAKPEREQVLLPPGKHSFRVSQYVFLSDFELNRDQPLFQELADLREQVYRELQLPPSATVVQVYIFEDRERYERFMKNKYPDLPPRRAFFVAQPRSVGGTEDLLVYTHWGERIHEDLRHELTHALLHSVLKDVPLWLDEGLAEFFELPPGQLGTNPQHLEQIRRGMGGAFQPNLVRLEGLSQVNQMRPAEYREAWAWVHLMLRGQPEGKAVLLAYLQQLRSTPNPGPLQPRLAAAYPDPEETLQKHLSQLDAGKRPVPTAQR
jgi:hypothetical protein